MEINKANMSVFVSESNAKKVTLPRYQRGYAWGDREDILDGFLKTFADFVDGVVATHPRDAYLGTIMEAGHKKGISGLSMRVVDGQQRITTTYLLYIALYAALKREAKLVKGTQLSELLIEEAEMCHRMVESRSSSKKNWSSKLLLSRLDFIVFNEICDAVFRDDPFPSSSNKSSLIRPGYLALAEGVKPIVSSYVEHIKAAQNADADWTIKLVNFPESLIITRIILDQSDDENNVFRSINQFSVPLSQGDLIKNFFLMQVGKDGDDEAEERFEHFYLKWEDEVDRPFWASANQDTLIRVIAIWFIQRNNYAKVVEKSLIHQIERYYRSYNTQNVLEVMSSILKRLEKVRLREEGLVANDYAERYHRILAKNSFYWHLPLFVLDDAIEESRITSQQAAEILQAIETLVMRRTFSDTPSNSTYSMIFPLGQIITESLEMCENAQDVVWTCISRILNTHNSAARNGSGKASASPTDVPSDQEIVNYLMVAPIYKNSYTSALLTQIEEYLRDSSHRSEPLPDSSIEHIMPRNPKNPWNIALSLDEYNVHVNTLGNLFLLRQGANSQAGDREFSYKKQVYAKHSLQQSLTLSELNVLEQQDWTPEHISRRSEVLAKLVTQIWGLPLDHDKMYARTLELLGPGAFVFSKEGRLRRSGGQTPVRLKMRLAEWMTQEPVVVRGIEDVKKLVRPLQIDNLRLDSLTEKLDNPHAQKIRTAIRKALQVDENGIGSWSAETDEDLGYMTKYLLSIALFGNTESVLTETYLDISPSAYTEGLLPSAALPLNPTTLIALSRDDKTMFGKYIRMKMQGVSDVDLMNPELMFEDAPSATYVTSLANRYEFLKSGTLAFSGESAFKSVVIVLEHMVVNLENYKFTGDYHSVKEILQSRISLLNNEIERLKHVVSESSDSDFIS